MRLEQHAQGDTVVLSETQLRLLERHSVEFRCRHVEASRPGELLNQDTFYWGTLKGVGKGYVQVVVDVFCTLAFAKVYTVSDQQTAGWRSSLRRDEDGCAARMFHGSRAS